LTGLRDLPPDARRVLLGCFVVQLALGCGYVFAPMLKHIVAEFAWSRAAFSAGGAPLLLAMALASPLIGDLTERLGARRVVAGATLVLALSLWLFSRMESLLAFYATCALFGIGLTGVGDIPVGAVAARWVRRSRGLALGFVYIGSNVGGSLVALLTAAVAGAAWGSWRLALGLLAVALLLGVLPLATWAIREPRNGRSAPVADPEPGTDGGGLGPALDLGQALRTRSFWLLAFLLFTFYFYYLALNQHLIAFLTDRGYSDAEAAARFSGAVALGVVAKLLIGALADRVPVRRALLLNFAVLSGGSLLLLFVSAPGALAVFLVAHGFATAAENVLLPLIVVNCFGLRHMARIYGALMLMLFPGGVLGPIFAGFAFDRFGEYRLAFMVFAVLNLLGLLGLAFVRRETER
jgi:MFS family permease